MQEHVQLQGRAHKTFALIKKIKKKLMPALSTGSTLIPSKILPGKQNFCDVYTFKIPQSPICGNNLEAPAQ